jgi:predicted Zn-dependent protease
MPLARLREDQTPCDVCGSRGGLCACTVAPSTLTARAEELSRAAMAAAAHGELHRALEVGRQALAIDGSSAPLWRVTGFAALALGDVGEAVASLRVAHTIDASSGADTWLTSLERGPAHAALERYNRALADAQAQRTDEAILGAQAVLNELPNFVPAARLLGLLYAEQGRTEEARAVWQAALATCSDDRELLRLLASTNLGSQEQPATPRRRSSMGVRAQKTILPAVTVGLALLTVVTLAAAVVSNRKNPDARTDSVRAPLATRSDSIALARALGQILAAESDSAVEALRALEPHTRQWPAAAKARAATISHERGRTHFTLGEKAFNSGQWRAATRELSWAVTYGDGSDYHPAAMYLLSRSHARTSQPSSAKVQAQEVLRRYPKSRYADGVMRAIASTGREP